MRDRVRIAGTMYRVRVEDARSVWRVAARPSQPGDPGGIEVAEWRVDGPDLNSVEDVTEGAGYLGRDYGENTDGRWRGLDTLGPLINTIDLSTYDTQNTGSVPGEESFEPGVTLSFGGLATTTNSIAGHLYLNRLFVLRGYTPAKVNLSTMTLERSGRFFDEPATSAIVTQSVGSDGSAALELSVGLGDGAPYEVVTNVAAHPNSDTWQTNSASQAIRIFAKPPDRVLGTENQEILGNFLTGSTTMRSPSWQSITFIREHALKFTGFGLDGSLWVIGTSNGPYVLDADTAEFFPIIPEIDNDDRNCVGMTNVFHVGLVIPLSDGVRFLRGGGGESWGVERFAGNTSPVQGRPTGHASTTKWLYQIVKNDSTDAAWLLAWRPFELGDPEPRLLQPFTLAKLTGVDSEWLTNVGRVNGLRTNHTICGGYDSDMMWFTVGRTAREIDDANYRYATSGTTYLTELRRQPGTIKDIEAVEFVADDCTTNRTIQVGISVDGATAQTLDAVTSDGFHRQNVLDGGGAPASWALGGYRIKPQVAYATNASTAAPKLIGPLRVFYRTRPRMVEVIDAELMIEDGGQRTATADRDALLDLWGSGPVKVEDDPDGKTYYVRIENVTVVDVAETGAGRNSARGRVRVAQVRATKWSA